MNIFEEMLFEIYNTDTSIIDWGSELFKRNEDEEEIGKMNQFQISCVACLLKTEIDHEKMHRTFAKFLNIESDDPDTVRKTLEKRVKDPIFVETAKKQNADCDFFEEKESLLRKILDYDLVKNFPGKERAAISFRKPGIIVWNEKYQADLILREAMENTNGAMIIGLRKDDHNYMKMPFWGKPGEA